MAEDEGSAELRAEHQALDRELEDELGRPNPDPLRVQELKRQKLRLKDEIAKAEEAG